MDPVTKLLNRWLAPLFAPVSRWLGQRDPGGSWRSAAEAAGLTGIERTSFLWMTASVSGWLGSLHVDLRSVPTRRGAPPVRISVKGVARPLSVRPEDLGSRIQKRLGMETEIETGDDLFDGEFLIQGRVALAHALLDADTRAGVRRLFMVTETARLGTGELVADHVEQNAGPLLADSLEQILDVAQRLVEPEDVGARIARNALKDRCDGVRRACLLALLANYRDHAATPETLLRACTDASEDVRLEAALALQEEGQAVLRALAFSADGETCAVRAIKALGARLAPAAALSLLKQSLARGRPAVAIGCIETLAARGDAGTRVPFERVLLEQGLVHSAESLRIAVAHALARAGTVAAVLPLQEAAQQARGTARRALQDAARAIQSRLTGAERGQLTVSSAERGTVTLAAEGGQVSLPDRHGSREE